MKKVKPAISRKAILNNIKRETKRNITFSINENLLNSFKKICHEGKVSMNEVIEELMKHFVDDGKQ